MAQASVSIANGWEKYGKAKTGAIDMVVFKAENA
jgi:hypothetical protein